MKITSVEMMHADAGWRPWSFVKIMTDEGLVGWSECTDSHGSPRGMAGVVEDMKPLLIGQDPREIEKLMWQMHSRTRQSPGSIIQKALGGIENALWDIKAKALGVPVYALFGGPVRETLPLYWSHCATSRVRAWQMVKKPQIQTSEDVKKFGEEVRASGYKAAKTNIGILGDNPHVYMPGFFKSAGDPALNADKPVMDAIDRWVGALTEAFGDSVGLALDLNFNFKTEGYIKIGRMLEKYKLLWLEIDTYDADALRMIKDSIRMSITSCENLYGRGQYRPYFERHAMDTASIDIIWNGFAESVRIANMAETYEMNVSPHNYNGHLSSFISAHWAALVPNLKTMEIDVDDVPWREDLFTAAPQVVSGEMKIPTAPGWGCDVREDVIREHPWPKT
ncbi:MAG TPA: mandelate racemase/muconate lactonizing enzyme family protein [Candidatus Paceibacterota bacterium]